MSKPPRIIEPIKNATLEQVANSLVKMPVSPKKPVKKTKPKK